ncbi:hypothetical protein EU244_025195 [Rhodococcus qingshengii]|nr:hypothetical protein [Rhodococcus qingshengii]
MTELTIADNGLILGMRHRKMSFAGEMGVWEVWAGGVELPAIWTGTVLQW